MAARTIDLLPGPGGLPVIGNAHQLKSDQLHLKLEQWADEYGQPYRFRIGSRPIIVTADSETINMILRDRPEGFRRWSSIENVFGSMDITGVFSAEGDDWKRQRRLAVQALNSNHLNRYFEVIHTSTDRLRRRWSEAADNGAVIDIQDDFMSYTVDVTSALAFGHDLNTIENPGNELQSHVAAIFPMIARRISTPYAYWRWIKLPSDRELERTLVAVRVAVNGFIEEARERLEQFPELRENPENFLESMLVAHDEDSSSYTENEIFGNTFTMLLAGEDTTANTLAWTSWFLSQHPEVFARLRDEADQRLGENLLADDFETAGHALYADAVIKESMRLKPVAPILFVEALCDAVVDGVAVSAGSRIILLARYAGISEDNFARPDSFEPSRWIDEDTEDAIDGVSREDRGENGRDEVGAAGRGAHDPSALVPFGAGPRFCPGRNLALIESKSVLMMLARNFDVELVHGDDAVEEQFAFTMCPRNLRVRLHHRNFESDRSPSGHDARRPAVVAD